MTAIDEPIRQRHRTAILIIGCLAQFMVVLDASIVNVALPSIRVALHFSEDDLQWVVNAYVITFAGFLLLGGRATDLLGQRRVFIAGLILFSLASLAGGMADDQTTLIVARLIQGLGAAITAPASLSVLTTTFTEESERNRAVGAWGAMGAAGGAAGNLLSGVLTDALSWRWILFVNVPIGLICVLYAARYLSERVNDEATRNFDLFGALSATAGMSAFIFGIVRTDSTGWGDPLTLACIAGGVALVGAFLINEGRFAIAPLMPLRLFHSRSLSAANVLLMLVGATTMPMWYFLSLYLQEVDGYSPLVTGLLFVPMTLILVISSMWASRWTERFGAKPLLITGMVGLTVGMLIYAHGIHVHSSYWGVLLIPCLLTSFVMPFSFVTGTITATAGVDSADAGIASGVVNTSRTFGGSLGLAILATLASGRSHHVLSHGSGAHQALGAGFQLAFLIGAAFAATATVVAVVWLPSLRQDVAVPPTALTAGEF